MSGAGHDPAVLDKLCPMHSLLSASGRIRHVTHDPVAPAAPLAGRRFLDTVTVKRPRGIAGMEDLRRAAGVKLHLALRDAPRTELKGFTAAGGSALIVNLFGISIFDGVQDYALTNADFAATDLAIEMLYLMEEIRRDGSPRRLNLRLQEARIAAEEQAYRYADGAETGARSTQPERLITAGEVCRDASSRLFQSGERLLGPCGGRSCAASRRPDHAAETRSLTWWCVWAGMIPWFYPMRSEGILRGSASGSSTGWKAHSFKGESAKSPPASARSGSGVGTGDRATWSWPMPMPRSMPRNTRRAGIPSLTPPCVQGRDGRRTCRKGRRLIARGAAGQGGRARGQWTAQSGWRITRVRNRPCICSAACANA